MSHSQVQFDRWGHIHAHTWPFQVYKQYNEELSRFIWASEAASQYTYKTLARDGAEENDEITKFFPLPAHRIATMKDIKGWRSVYNDSQNWMRLNCNMAMSSNLETFFASIVALAIESNPGILLGATRKIDGGELLKAGGLDKKSYDRYIEACSSGSWSSRLAAFEKLFGSAPDSYRNGIKTLERIGKMRNNLGHAFGRDIDESRNFTTNTKLATYRIQFKTLIKYLEMAYNIVSDVDAYLLDNHIGEFQAIVAYHKNYGTYSKLATDADRVAAFKKNYGATDQSIGKEFCKGVVAYYKSL